MKKCNILVVEDEALIAANLVHTLSSLGYAVQKPVATGEEAIRAVKARQPDLVLMDIQLIGAMNGIEAAEKIRAIADIPIVYLTAHTDDLRLQQAQLTEPYGYIVKPAHSRELHATIEMALYKHGLDRKLKESEERNRSIVEALPGFIFHFSVDGRFIDCQFNKGDLLLIPPDQIIGKQVAEILPPDLAHLTERMIRETLDSGQLQIFEYSLTLKDQKHFFEARMITSGTNSVLAFVYEITERKVAEEALAESEQKYRNIFEKSVTGLFKSTPDGSLIEVNDAFARIYDYSSAAEMLADSKADRLNYISRHLYANPEDRKEIHHILSEKGEIKNYETLNIKRDGTHLWVSITARVIQDTDNNVLLFEGTVIDITKRKVAEEALKKSQIQLAEAMDLAHLVNWEFDVATGIFTFDDRFYALYGTTAELEGGNQMSADVYAKKFVHPDDQYLVADEVNKAIQATDPGY
ncbi:MAG: PAS domain S-box protein, partial [Deltaproteobacteria bacterium]